jgi:3-methyl-2-oxobutanoate hydroxymethyltransferase
MNDLLGLNFGHSAKFVRRYADLRSTMSEAINRYAEDVRNLRYPGVQESYDVSQEERSSLSVEEQPDNDDTSYVLFSQ